jgi:hypothetical protein
VLEAELSIPTSEKGLLGTWCRSLSLPAPQLLISEGKGQDRAGHSFFSE